MKIKSSQKIPNLYNSFVNKCTLNTDNKLQIIWALTRETLSSGFPSKRDSNQSPQLQRLARKLEASLHIILLKKGITKALISLRGCAGWCALLLFANPLRQVFSRPAHMEVI